MTTPTVRSTDCELSRYEIPALKWLGYDQPSANADCKQDTFLYKAEHKNCTGKI